MDSGSEQLTKKNEEGESRNDISYARNVFQPFWVRRNTDDVNKINWFGTIAIRAKLIMNANGKTLYQIDVNNFNSHESYITTDYTRDKETGCITFKDEFGLKHVVCNSYSITEY